jgi:lipid-A-disaccharide synthase
VNPERLGLELTRLLDPATARRIRVELSEVRGHLGEPGAAGRVVEDLLRKLGA